ncbi:MAG: hypothetical protein IJP70_00900 [Bacteroidales bacterium]|nr:hypothetical protein [Bacteroidales bacterium]
MKKLFALCWVSAIAMQALMAASDFSEDFNSLAKNTSYSSATEVKLPSGTWTMKGIVVNNSSNVTSLKFNTSDAYVITPAMDSVQRVGFTYRAGGSNKPVTVSYSTDNGASWTEIETFTIQSSSSSFAAWNKKPGLDSTLNVRFKVFCAASNVYIDDFTASFYKAGSEVVTDPDDPTYVTVGVPVPTKAFPQALHEYYIAPDGNDATGDGSKEKPWFNLQYAVNKTVPGDHIVCRGGTYKFTQRDSSGKLTVRLKTSGTADAPIVIRSYEDEKPVFDFEQQLLDCDRSPSKVGDRGIQITGNYWWLFGLHIMHAADNGIKLEGSYNRIERCEFSYNLDTGLQLGFGHNFSDAGFGVSSNDGTYCAYNDIIDCDSHHNCDFDSNYGSDADGFACKMHNGKGNRFIRCRAWRNSDDAWDLYETDYSVLLAECWAWESGNAEDHTWVKEYFDGSASFSGNGNGIKLGGNGTGGSSKGVHYAYNCIAFGCDKSGSVKGFDCNSHKGGHVLVGCLAFDNGYDFMFESGGSDTETAFYNNVCLGRQEICVGRDDYNAITSPMSKNGWSNHLVTGVSKDDYVSLDEEDALKPRSIDGSLPRRFGRLMSDSKLVDAGSVQYGMPADLLADFPFLVQQDYGRSRDLGPYELKVGEVLGLEEVSSDSFASSSADPATYNLQGQRVGTHYRGLVIRNGKKILLR